MTGNNKPVMAGLVPAIHGSHELIVKIVPVGICREDQTHLPRSRPMLHVSLTLNGRSDIRVRLHVDESLQTVSFGEAADQTFPVFPGTMPYIGCDAGVQDAVRPIGDRVYPG